MTGVQTCALPISVEAGANHDVRPHPHIGLATVTYLFDGAIMHRDSLGSAQRIEPGAINWMTAGRGIVHSERAPEDLRDKSYLQHGLQLWAALPSADEEAMPEFSHTPAADIPVFARDGVEVRVLIGEAFGKTSPVRTFSKTIYLDIGLAAGASLELPPLADELAVYSVDGDLLVDGEPLAARTLDPGAGGGHATERQRPGPFCRDWRRCAGRQALHLVELRVQPQGAHRSGER